LDPLDRLMPDDPLAAQREGSRVQTCHQLARGDLVEAKVGSNRHLRGVVVEVQPSMELFWVVSRDGSRQIIELSDFEVYFAA
jgi:hypothetical protein